MPQPLVNGTSYSWAQIEARILNQPVAGIKEIKYEEKQEIVDNYGAGNRPVSRGYGKIETTASLKLEMAELEALQAAAPDRRLQAIPEFDIVVSYLPEGGKITSHTLHNVRFKTNGREAKEGDTSIDVDIELAVSHISW
jgi:hypothetical protein